MANENPQDLVTDPPIVVQGGGSVNLDLPPQFKENGNNPNGKKFRSEKNLASIEIDGGKPIPLNENSRIVIRFK
jgi:hypothetical protein